MRASIDGEKMFGSQLKNPSFSSDTTTVRRSDVFTSSKKLINSNDVVGFYI